MRLLSKWKQTMSMKCSENKELSKCKGRCSHSPGGSRLTQPLHRDHPASYDTHSQLCFFPLSTPVTFPAPSGSEGRASFPLWRAHIRKTLSTHPAAQHLGNCRPSVPSGGKTEKESPGEVLSLSVQQQLLLLNFHKEIISLSVRIYTMLEFSSSLWRKIQSRPCG